MRYCDRTDRVASAAGEVQLAVADEKAGIPGVEPEVPKGVHRRRQVVQVAEHHAVRLARSHDDLTAFAGGLRTVEAIDDV